MGKLHTTVGLLAHVDAGKTTLSEALLYCSGAVRTLGRVDHKDAFLDTHELERQRGITIFSKQARLATKNREITLVDTPGHADFAALQKFKTPEIGNFKNNKELDSYMKKEYSQITPCDFSQLPCPDSDDIKTSYLFMQFLSMWVQYFWQLLITSLIFAIFYAITGVGKISNMNFKAFCSVSIYAGFPAMLVSVLFEAFKLPFIGYHTVFSFGWLIYLLVILNSFVRDREQTE